MHVLFVWEQGLGYGHLGHLFPVARLLKARGHQVTLAVRKLESVWAATDMPFERVLPAPNVHAASLDQETRTFSDVIRPSGFASASMLQACTHTWLTLFELIAPDAIVCDHAYNALYAARVHGLPAARMGTGFTVPNAKAALPPMRIWQPHSQAQCRAADAELLDVLQQAQAVMGGPTCQTIGDLFGYGEEFVVSWPELDHLGPQSGRFYYGPMEGLKGAARPDWPAGREANAPKIFMYLPGGHPHEGAALRALARLGWSTIFHSRKAPALPPASSQCFSEAPVDTHAVLSQADLFITHGSHGTCADALRARCRQFLLPNSFERVLLSYQMVKNGLASLAQGDLSNANEMADQLVTALSAMPPALAKASKVYAGYDPARAADELAEDMLAYFASQRRSL